MMLIGAFMTYSFFNFHAVESVSNPSSDSLNYHADVCVYKNGILHECNHNVLYNNGKNMTRDMLGYGGTLAGNVSTISLCNASTGSACGTPVAAGSEAYTAYDSCGLNAATGSYAVLTAYDGNWTITKTFTSTCDNRLVNVTRLTNASGSIFAGNTFSLVTLQTNDQLTVNWTIMIS